MPFRQPSAHLVAALATLTAIIATGVAGFLLEQNLELRQLVSQPPALVKVSLQPAASASASAVKLDTSARRTYRNEQYGFEIKYPVDWKQPVVNDYKTQLTMSFFWLDGEGAVLLTVDKGISLSDLMDRVRKIFGNANVLTEIPINIDGGAGMRYSLLDNGGFSEVVVFEKGNFGISLMALSGYEKQVDQILSTFKFTK